MLMANLQTETGLVNSSIRTIQDIIFKEDQGLLSLSIAILISFNNYKGSIIASLEDKRVVPIILIRHT